MSNNSDVPACANCGKGEEAGIDLKACTACKLVKYCSRECQIAHRPQHKKQCKKRAKELHDEKLFKQPPRPEEDDCPICMIRLPTLNKGRTYMSCCGKLLCNGCIHAFRSRVTKRKDDVCPFCRTPMPTSLEESNKRYEKRMDMNDAIAIVDLGCMYRDGENGYPQNYAKALELWHRAGELGCGSAYSFIGYAYHKGRGVEVDEKKAEYYAELAAIEGELMARHNLGCYEGNLGNMDRALKHWMIAVKDGCANSLEDIKLLYSKGHATKDDYTKALRYYQAYLNEVKSDQRDEAAAARSGSNSN